MSALRSVDPLSSPHGTSGQQTDHDALQTPAEGRSTSPDEVEGGAPQPAQQAKKKRRVDAASSQHIAPFHPAGDPSSTWSPSPPATGPAAASAPASGNSSLTLPELARAAAAALDDQQEAGPSSQVQTHAPPAPPRQIPAHPEQHHLPPHHHHHHHAHPVSQPHHHHHHHLPPQPPRGHAELAPLRLGPQPMSHAESSVLPPIRSPTTAASGAQYRDVASLGTSEVDAVCQDLREEIERGKTQLSRLQSHIDRSERVLAGLEGLLASRDAAPAAATSTSVQAPSIHPRQDSVPLPPRPPSTSQPVWRVVDDADRRA